MFTLGPGKRRGDSHHNIPSLLHTMYAGILKCIVLERTESGHIVPKNRARLQMSQRPAVLPFLVKRERAHVHNLCWFHITGVKHCQTNDLPSAILPSSKTGCQAGLSPPGTAGWLGANTARVVVTASFRKHEPPATTRHGPLLYSPVHVRGPSPPGHLGYEAEWSHRYPR